MATTSAPRRTFEPLHSLSREAGTFERTFWSPPDPGRWRIVREAERFNRRTKKPGDRAGRLTSNADKVLAYLASIVGKDGRLDPSLATIAKACALARSTVQKAIKALVASDFLERVRRFIRVDQPRKGRCPPVRQTSNAYRLKMRPADPVAEVADGARPLAPADELERAAEARRQAERAAADWAAMTEAERWAVVRPHARPRQAVSAPAPAGDLVARLKRLAPRTMSAADRAQLAAQLARQAAEREARRGADERDTVQRSESPLKDSFP